jgi:hypothetical protein
MKVSLVIFAIWALGSILTFVTVGIKYIIPYALVTMALFALGVWLANKKNQPPAAGSAYGFALPVLVAGQLPIGYLLAAIGLLVVAYVAKAAIDNLTHQAGNSIFEKWGKWFDARVSWLNKYKPGSWEAGAKQPRFLGSTTVFVWLTDFWHAADSVYLTAYLVGGMLLGAWLGPAGAWPWLLAVALVKGGGGALFQACYRLFRITK